MYSYEISFKYRKKHHEQMRWLSGKALASCAEGRELDL